MYKLIKTTFFIVLFMSSAFAFEGELTYEVQEGEFSKSTNAAKIKIYLVDSRLRVDYISSIDTELTSIYLNYKLGTGYFVQNKNKELIDLRTVFKAADFLMPEELTKNDPLKCYLKIRLKNMKVFILSIKQDFLLRYGTHHKHLRVSIFPCGISLNSGQI